MDKLLTIGEVAALFQVTSRTVYTMMRRYKLPCYKVGGSWRFKPSEIERWVTRNRYTP